MPVALEGSAAGQWIYRSDGPLTIYEIAGIQEIIKSRLQRRDHSLSTYKKWMKSTRLACSYYLRYINGWANTCI